MKEEKYPPTKRRLKQLLDAEKRLEELGERDFLKPLTEAFCKALGTLAASTPYKRWPKEFRKAWQHVEYNYRGMGTSLYLERLPKD